MKILDCTLRDGGYYTNWNFDHDKVIDMVRALDAAGVDIIELGYKSLKTTVGIFGECPDKFIDLTVDNINKGMAFDNIKVELAFMLDVKEFTGNNFHDLSVIIQPANHSPFTWARLATHYATIEYMPRFVKWFKNMGYKVSFNLMGGTLLDIDACYHVSDVVAESNPNVFCFADSFGQMKYCDNYNHAREPIKIGLHLHDNLGTATHNALRMINDDGVDIIDSSILGMGRGAGNARTEMLVKNYEPLLPVIDNFIGPLWEKYHWGPNTAYRYCAEQSIHPLYCQRLLEKPGAKLVDVHDILSRIPAEHKTKYNADILAEVTK